jgi:ComF family protein
MLHRRVGLVLRSWRKAGVDSLLPHHCVLCGQRGTASNLCSPCHHDLPRVGRCCRRCALPFATAEPECGRCLRRPPPWDCAVAALTYAFPVDRIVCRFKFNRDFACGRLLGYELLTAVCSSEAPLPELIVPVPLHRTRHFARTFNQADVLARTLGGALQIPVRSRLLTRTRRTRAQAGLDAGHRKRNIRGAIRCDHAADQIPADARVALVDDVLTTGATLRECAKALRRAGAAHLSIWVAARAPAP